MACRVTIATMNYMLNHKRPTNTYYRCGCVHLAVRLHPRLHNSKPRTTYPLYVLNQSISPLSLPTPLLPLRETPKTTTTTNPLPKMDAWLRNFGTNLAHAGATIHAHLDSFGQDTGRRLDAWGKDVGQHMDPSHPVHQAMVIAGSVSFVAANEASRVLGVARQQTQHSVTGAYNNVHWYVTQVPWEQLAQEVQVVV